MGLFFFDLNALEQLDRGVPAVMFRHAIQDVINDLVDRATDKRPRKVVLELAFTPIAVQDEDDPNKFRASGAHCEMVSHCKIPERRTRPYAFDLDRNGRLYFSAESPENPRQTTLDEINPETGRIERGAIRDVRDVGQES